MKKFYILWIALFMVNGAIGQSNQPCATCLPQGITFSYQSQINNFQTNYPNCTQISGYVKIMGSNITNLNGLSVLTSIEGYLAITYNSSLTSLSGLEGLTSVGGSLSIESNNALTNLTGLAGLTSIGGSGIWINSNPLLTSLTGLENLKSVDGGTQGGYVSIHDNPQLADLSGLEGLTTIGKDLEIRNNPTLINLAGLDGLRSIGGDLRIESNTSLNNLVGLDSLTSVGGSLIFYWNSSLSSLTGLENINGSSLTGITINGNNSLSSCAIQGICDFLVNPNGTIFISNNAIGCNSQTEVETACAVLSVEEIATGKGFRIYPNPSSTHLTIETSSFTNTSQVSITNLNDQNFLTCQITGSKTQIDVSNLPGGLYFVRLKGERSVAVGKFVKQ